MRHPVECHCCHLACILCTYMCINCFKNFQLTGTKDKGNLRFYSIHRDSIKHFTAFPVATVLNDGVVQKHTSPPTKYYQFFNKKGIYVKFYAVSIVSFVQTNQSNCKLVRYSTVYHRPITQRKKFHR